MDYTLTDLLLTLILVMLFCIFLHLRQTGVNPQIFKDIYDNIEEMKIILEDLERSISDLNDKK